MRTLGRCVAAALGVAVMLISVGCAPSAAPAAKAPEKKAPEAKAPEAKPPAAKPDAAKPAPSAPAPAADPHALAVPDVGKAAVKVDGVLDEEVWKKAASSEAFGTDDGSKPGARTRLLVAQGDGRIYVAVEAFDDEAKIKNLKADVTEHDGDGIWEDDDVELFIGPAGDRSSYYQIIVNPKGATWDSCFSSARNSDASWNPKYDSAVKVGKESWVAELALPVSVFDHTDKPAAKWDFNVLRMRTATGEGIYWSPVGAGSSSHTPQKFGTLSGMPAGK